MRRVATLLSLLLLGEALGGEAESILSRHLDRLKDLRTLVLRAERRTALRGKSTTERWTYRQKGADKFRIDYEFPTPRVIVSDGQELWESIPAVGKAAVTRLASLVEKQREAVLHAALSRVAVEGLRFEPGATDRVVRDLGLRSFAGRPARGVECTRSGEGKPRAVRGWIDAERLVLVACEFLDADGQVAMRTETRGFLEAAPGVWFPREVRVERLGPNGRSEVVTLTQVALNGEMPDELFVFQVPPDVEVIGERRQER